MYKGINIVGTIRIKARVLKENVNTYFCYTLQCVGY